MNRHLGLGPVFSYECLTASRRWQGYAIRSGFVAVLLAVLSATAATVFSAAPTPRQLAQAGESFFLTIAFLELTAVLLVAPASTAGAICLDRARGSLAHLMSTELSSSEIVLGKLAARLLPSIGLVIATIPIMAMASWLGGIDVLAMLGAALVTIGTAAVGSSLAMALSLRGRRPHEVLFTTYMLIAGWVLLGPVLVVCSEILLAPIASVTFKSFLDLAWWINPYVLAFGPYQDPSQTWLGRQFLFLIVCLVITAGLSAFAISQIRRVAFLRERPRQGKLRAAWDRLGRALPGPSIDRNPVLWRQWHYARPSLGSRIARGLFTAIILVLAVVVVVATWKSNRSGGSEEAILLLDALYLFFGMLFLSVTAPMALAEERTRSSLDILLSTPLSTPSIVWAKWWGTFRAVPPLMVIPAIVQVLLANPDRRWIGFFVSNGLLLATGAFLTSFGLAVSLVTPRLGRAIGLSVGGFVLLTLGSWFVAMIWESYPHPADRDDGLAVLEAGPAFGAGVIAAFSSTADSNPNTVPGSPASWGRMIGFGIGWMVAYASIAAILYGVVLLRFDRCLGRVRQRPEHRGPIPSPNPPGQPIPCSPGLPLTV